MGRDTVTMATSHRVMSSCFKRSTTPAGLHYRSVYMSWNLQWRTCKPGDLCLHMMISDRIDHMYSVCIFTSGCKQHRTLSIYMVCLKYVTCLLMKLSKVETKYILIFNYQVIIHDVK